jgi:hypothetical protein
MKHKYRIWKKEKGKELLIQEYAVLTAASRKQKHPGLINQDFSLLCEQSYQADEVKKATSRGKDELIVFLRNQHFFPIGMYMNLIADSVMTMYSSKGEQHEDLIFDDKEVLLVASPEAEKKATKEIEAGANGENQAENIDDLLEDDSQITKNNVTDKIKPEQLDEE